MIEHLYRQQNVKISYQKALNASICVTNPTLDLLVKLIFLNEIAYRLCFKMLNEKAICIS